MCVDFVSANRSKILIPVHVTVFLDFEKAFDSIEWNYLQKFLEVFKLGPQLQHWMKVFYNDISSCVLNNGFRSEHFMLSRGGRQGCPLSGLLFIIGIEILGNAIRQASNIKGINIAPGKTPKLAQYVEDTTIFVKDDQSIYNLFNLLHKKRFGASNKPVRIRTLMVRVITSTQR